MRQARQQVFVSSLLSLIGSAVCDDQHKEVLAGRNTPLPLAVLD
jgi:hypothetical protein